MLSVILPTLNANRFLPATVAALAVALVSEIVVVDGGSEILPVAGAPALRVIVAARGRGQQLAAGVAAARNDWLLLLHADTVLQPGWDSCARHHMASHPNQAAYFRFALASRDPQARRLERLVAWRCRIFALPYGDQGLLVHRDLLVRIGGVPIMPLMEDVALVRHLGRQRLVGIDAIATTSAHKWEQQGWTRRSLRNLCCLSLYLIGIPPSWIARIYP